MVDFACILSTDVVFLGEIRAGGGIGKRGSLRGCWALALGGSNPPPRTINLGKDYEQAKSK